MSLTIAIPTYNRRPILIDTLERLFALSPPADTIIVADQTPGGDETLQRWHDEGRIRWMRLPAPSIPRAMNEALLAADGDLVLFLDDDVIPSPALAGAHAVAHRDDSIWAVVGQILQPGEEPRSVSDPDPFEFSFDRNEGAFIGNTMAGNLSVRRERALSIGAFDEQFVGAAYRFESDFALRLLAAGGKIWFEPAASLRHLKLSSGGLRSFGDHRTTASPMHAVGDYYFALRHDRPFVRYALTRLRKNVLTRFHLLHPWTIPSKLVGEIRGMLLARRLAAGGRRLIGEDRR